MYFVYVLRNPEGRLYVGYKADLARRLAEHASGMARWTKTRGPWKLVLSETYGTRAQSMRRERSLKSGRTNQELRKRLIQDPEVERVLPGKD